MKTTWVILQKRGWPVFIYQRLCVYLSMHFSSCLLACLLTAWSTALHAQASTVMIPGEFHLQGVTEVASGFRFNADSTFDFYFVYGAVDRFGRGRWQRAGETVILNSPARTEPDFILQEAKELPGAKNQLVVQVKDANRQILGYVYGQVKLADGSTVQAESDADGRIVFPLATRAVEFSLIHGLWPNQPVPFALTDPRVNYYEFSISRQIVEVEFRELVLRAEGDNLVGAHPLMEEEEFTYVRAK
jgi:hypothetical protein